MANFEIQGPDGKKYRVQGENAEGALAALKKMLGDAPQQPPERGMGEQALRYAEMGSRGFLDSAAETLGALPDASAWLTNKIGLTDLPPGFWTGQVKAGSEAAQKAISAPLNAALDRTGQYMQPEGDTEKFAYGAGRGAGDAASIMLPAAGVARAARAGSVTQGTGRALAAQPVMQTTAGAAGGGVGEATDNPLLGLLAAMGVPGLAALGRRAVTPVTNRLSAEEQRLAQVAANEGINLRAGQRTGSKPLQALESVFERLPFTSGSQSALREGQQEAFNRAVLQRAGVNADVATPDVLDAQARQLGQQFENISAQTTVNLDNQFLTELQAAATRYANKLPTNTRPVFQSYIDDIMNTGNQMAGPVYQQTRSDLTRQVKQFSNNDPGLSNALRLVRDSLDNAADRSIPQNLHGEWQETRRQYANLKSVLNSMSRPSAGAAAGDVSPANLWSASRQGQTKDQFARGQGELNDLARVGQTFLKEQTPDSGTPIRTFWQNMLTGGPAGLGVGIAAMGEPITGSALAAASLGGPRLAQALMNSPWGQSYLTNQLLPGAGMNWPTIAAILGARGKAQLAPPPTP